MTGKKPKLYYRIAAIAAAVGLFVVLYLVLITALPKYAGRVPFLLALFMLDWLILWDISTLWKNWSNKWKTTILILWWIPLILLLLFLIGTAIIPLQSMPEYLRIYLPGIALMAYMAKMFMLIPLLPVFLLQVSAFFARLISGFKSNALMGVIKFLKRMGIFFGSLAFAGLIIGSTLWVYKFKTHRVPIVIPDLPAAFQGLKIVQLSDIHLGSWVSAQPLQRAVDSVNALKPDIIVFTGDMVNYTTSEVKGFEDALSKLKAPMGIYAILGNHDYGDYVAWKTPEAKQKNLDDLVAFYNKLGWKLLRNQVSILHKDSSSLMIAGVENWSATARFKRYGDMEQTLKNQLFADVNILLSHDPTHWEAEVFEKYPEFGLTLSGHTHGMQMGIEAFGLKWSPAQYMYKNWAGLARYHSASGGVSNLYVNRGLGHIAYPGRIGILPEITLITLVREK